MLQSGGSFSGWADLGFVTDSVGFVVGPTHNAPGHLYRTQDGGRTWRVVPVLILGVDASPHPSQLR